MIAICAFEPTGIEHFLRQPQELGNLLGTIKRVELVVVEVLGNGS
jgi:hypothetical protein